MGIGLPDGHTRNWVAGCIKRLRRELLRPADDEAVQTRCNGNADDGARWFSRVGITGAECEYRSRQEGNGESRRSAATQGLGERLHTLQGLEGGGDFAAILPRVGRVRIA